MRIRQAAGIDYTRKNFIVNMHASISSILSACVELPRNLVLAMCMRPTGAWPPVLSSFLKFALV